MIVMTCLPTKRDAVLKSRLAQLGIESVSPLEPYEHYIENLILVAA